MSQRSLLIDLPGLQIDDLEYHLSTSLHHDERDKVAIGYGALPNWYRSRSFDPEVLAAVITGGAAVLAAVILAVASLHASKGGKRLVILFGDGRRIEIPTDACRAMIHEAIQGLPSSGPLILLAEETEE